MTERVDQVFAVLPRGNSLDDVAWWPRHRLLLWLLAAHLPGLLLAGILTGNTAPVHAAELLPIAAGLGVGLASRSRLVRSMAVTLGLVAGASVLVHFTGGVGAAHFHYFVVLGFVALYQDWRPYLAAVCYLVIGHGIMGALYPGLIYNEPAAIERPWLWAVIQGGFVLAACTAHVIFWKQTERQQLAAEAYYNQVYEGERAVVSKLRQAQTVKEELLGVVGHEFRTPLTSIQGFARTIEARYDRMDREAVETCTQAIEREAKRLTRMVSNVLTASEEIKPDPDKTCRLSEIAGSVVREVTGLLPTAARSVQVHVPPEHVVRMSRDHSYELLFSLVDNAVKFAISESDVRLSTRREDDTVVLEVTNVGVPISPADRDRIFDAFVQSDSSDTRRYGGMGLGLHIARSIVTAYGGTIGAYCEGPIVVFRASLPAATAATGHAPHDTEQPAAGLAPGHRDPAGVEHRSGALY